MPQIEMTELKPDTKAEEQKKDPAQKSLPEEEVSTHQSNTYADRASALGWMPKEDWVAAGHDENDWKPAKVFIEHGDMIGKIRSQNQDMDRMRKALLFAQNQNSQVYERGYQNALAELRQQKRAALANNDLVKADEIDEQIDATKAQINQIAGTTKALGEAAKTSTPQVDPEHKDWVAENPWYDTDKRLAKYADQLAVEYFQENNGNVSAAQIRAYVAKEVRKEFPERTNGNRPKPAPSPDAESRHGTTGRSANSNLNSKLSQAKDGMTDEQRSIMKTIMKSTGMSEKKYLELYAQ